MKHILDFLHQFDPRDTPQELVNEYFQAYEKSGNGSLVYSLRNQNNKERIKVIRGSKCEICGLECPQILQIHHVIPREDGGTGNISNLSILCPTCHVSVHYTMETGDYTTMQDLYNGRLYKKLKMFVNKRRC